MTTTTMTMMEMMVSSAWMFMQPISIVRMRRVTLVGQVLPDNDKQIYSTINRKSISKKLKSR